jgi:hypothetical protein
VGRSNGAPAAIQASASSRVQNGAIVHIFPHHIPAILISPKATCVATTNAVGPISFVSPKLCNSQTKARTSPAVTEGVAARASMISGQLRPQAFRSATRWVEISSYVTTPSTSVNTRLFSRSNLNVIPIANTWSDVSRAFRCRREFWG